MIMVKTVLLVFVAAIAAPADQLLPLINDLRQFNRWNPYARKDPAMKADYSGAAARPGAVFS